MACQLYLRHLPLVRKSLLGFCSRSECCPGRCLNEELVGETFPVFLRALHEFNPERGVDFLGYVSQRLSWGMEHAAGRRLRACRREQSGDDLEQLPSEESAEERGLASVLVAQLLGRLTPEDAWLVEHHYAIGRPSRELAETLGLSDGAIRKRLERLRRRLRDFASGTPGVSPRAGDRRRVRVAAAGPR
jgi:RNA polymerase sigma factor (sigma-70 family)